MSLLSSLSAGFKNAGHYFASGAHYLSLGIGDFIKFANKAQPVEPELEALVTALAGPAAARLVPLAFNALGSTAAALSKVGDDAASIAAVQAQFSAVGIQHDTQTLMDLKAAAKTIEAIFAALKVPKPA